MANSHTNINSTPTNLFSTPDVASNHTPPPDVFLYPFHSPSVARELIDTANSLVNPRGRGIYATDEAPEVIASMLNGEKKGQKQTEEELRDQRRRWRVASYESLSSEYISGVILYLETLVDFKLAPLLSDKGIIPGVRANGELRSFPNSTSEFIVEGLDGLLAKLQAARIAGARFSKFRVPIACTSVAQGLPTQASLEVQAETLAQYAAISQQAGLVPIVEPDVEFSADADLARSTEVHHKAISLIYPRCLAHGVLLEGSLLKPSFPQPGLQHPSRAQVTSEDIAVATATLISRSVPPAVPGVVFLSDGLSSAVATGNLRAVNALVNSAAGSLSFSRLPHLSFSFGRALQGEAVVHWTKGDEQATKEAFEKWSKTCWNAAKGVL